MEVQEEFTASILRIEQWDKQETVKKTGDKLGSAKISEVEFVAIVNMHSSVTPIWHSRPMRSNLLTAHGFGRGVINYFIHVWTHKLKCISISSGTACF
jgi:hypothetical protein